VGGLAGLPTLAACPKVSAISAPYPIFFTCMTTVDLRGTPLEYLPPSMAALPRLENIDLRWVANFDVPVWS
jgi:hypothetical protein